MKNEDSTPPWKKSAPKGTKHIKLTEEQKKEARASAQKAGRPYPNLVDNMKIAKKVKAAAAKKEEES